MKWLISLSFVFLAAHASAGGAIDFKDLLDPIKDMQGEFKQTIKDKSGEVVQKSDGAFAVKRPGYFHWQTQEPFAQTVVGTPEKVWVYDPDLEQVSISKSDPSSQDNPMNLLTGTATEIESRFEVTTETKNGVTRFNLVPKNQNNSYAAVQFAFKGDTLSEISFDDKLQQHTSIQISKLSTNQALTDDKFVFKIPPGTDVVEND